MSASTNAPGSMPPFRGDLGRHRLIARLAQGGMGDVYLAMTQGPGGFHKLAVIKELRSSFADEGASLRMFLDEARLAARLHHPNVVQTNEVGSENGRHFMVMEYLEGQPLQRILTRLGREGAFPAAMQIRVIADALKGLHYAHELMEFDGTPLGVVHRDFTPHNVFVTYDGPIKVVDFGIAKARDTHETRTGVVKGKAAYMAPEQALGKQVDRRAYIFSAGVMLWEAATGQRMWSGLTEVQILMKVVQETVPSPRYVNPYVPSELARICVRALAKDPSERYATADELRRELETFLEGMSLTVSAHEVGALVAASFAEERAKIRGLVDANLKQARAAAASTPSSIPPPLGASLSSSPPPSFGAAGYNVNDSLDGEPSMRGTPSDFRPGVASFGPNGAFTVGAPRPQGFAPRPPDLTKSHGVPDASSELRAFSATASGRTFGTPSTLRPPALSVRPQKGVGFGIGLGFLAACVLGLGVYTFVGRSRAPEARASEPLTVVAAPPPVVTDTAPSVPEPVVAPVAPSLPSAVHAPEPERAPVAEARPSVERRSRSSHRLEVDEVLPRPTASVEEAPRPSAAPAPVAPPPVAPAAPPPGPPAPMAFNAAMARPTLLSGQDPVYTREARLARVEGTMIVKCTITTAGTLDNCRVVKAVPHMEQAVLDSLRTRRYTPVVYEGRPTAVDYVFNIQLVLPR